MLRATTGLTCARSSGHDEQASATQDPTIATREYTLNQVQLGMPSPPRTIGMCVRGPHSAGIDVSVRVSRVTALRSQKLRSGLSRGFWADPTTIFDP